MAQASLRQAHRVRERLTAVGGATAARAERPRSQLDHYRDLVGRVVSQTERRVLHGETVPAAEKVTSLFEPHTAVIARGKARRPTEFGLKVVLDEVEGGLVTRYAVAPGNPPDAVSWAASLDHHLACFGRPPDTATGDRGFFTPDNERQARRLGVRWVALPQPGGRSAARQQQERQPGFRRA